MHVHLRPSSGGRNQRWCRLLTSAIVAVVAFAGGMPAADAKPREVIRVVGSSTMYRMSSYVAETFGRQGRYPTPVIESTGTGGGFKLFCGGIGDDYPDLAAASRLMTEGERQNCAEHDVDNVIELEVGTGGLVIANAANGAVFNLTRRHIWLALAEKVPVNSQIVANPYTHWNEIDPTLPTLPILVYGPPLTSGTRDALSGMVLESVCMGAPEMASLSGEALRTTCLKLREDGAYVDAGEYDDNLLRRVAANSNAIGIIGFHVLKEDPAIKAASIDGISPTVVSIMSGHYPLVRSLYVYVKGDHLNRIPGLADLVRTYVSEDMIGPSGDLTENGLVPLPNGERAASQAKAASLKGR